MKIYAVNGSPRKKGNSAQMLQSFVDGAKSITPDADIEFVNLYDYKYTDVEAALLVRERKIVTTCVVTFTTIFTIF